MRNEVLRYEHVCNPHIDRNLFQREVAALLNVRQNMYFQYEIEVLSYPIDVLVRLVCYYDTSVDYLLGLTDERTPHPRAKNRDFRKSPVTFR